MNKLYEVSLRAAMNEKVRRSDWIEASPEFIPQIDALLRKTSGYIALVNAGAVTKEHTNTLFTALKAVFALYKCDIRCQADDIQVLTTMAGRWCNIDGVRGFDAASYATFLKNFSAFIVRRIDGERLGRTREEKDTIVKSKAAQKRAAKKAAKEEAEKAAVRAANQKIIENAKKMEEHNNNNAA